MACCSVWTSTRALQVIALLITMAPLFACTDSGVANSPQEPIEDGTYFVRDADGRVLILRGLNIMSAAKGDPERLPPNLKEEDVERYARQWGFNVVRYLIFWDAVEPTPGNYDAAYFDKTEERLDWFAENDIHVILDMHQDVYAQRFCCDGAPEWAIEDDDLPFDQNEVWDLNYFAPAVMAAFDNFFDYEGEHGDLQDHFADAWAAVAGRFKDHPAVIGYDILNEPSPGSALDAADFSSTSPDSAAADFDRTVFTDFYQRMVDAIREVDDQAWILYEPRYAAPANGQASYLRKLEDPRTGEPRIVYSPHLYSIQVEFLGQYDPSNDETLDTWEGYRSTEVAAQEAPMLVGEWGLHPDWGNAELFMREVLAMSDRMMASWTYWSYDPGGWGIWDADAEGNYAAERENADTLIRPYPRAVAGIPRLFSYDPDTRVFELALDPSPSATLPTEVYLPALRHYPDGWSISGCEASEGCEHTWQPDLEILQVFTTGRTERLELRIAPND